MRADFLVRRLIGLVVVLMMVATITFMLLHLAPGDPVIFMLGDGATIEQMERLRHELGLDKPLLFQLFQWYSRLIRFDLGDSLTLKMPVGTVILQRIEPTLMLATLTILVAVLLGLPMGVLAATHHNRPLDQIIRIISLSGVSIPTFWLGILLILWLAVGKRWFPAQGYSKLEDGFLLTIKSLTLPVLALGLSGSSFITRMMRASMLDILQEDYLRTARSKGLQERVVIYRHALRNAILPTITVIASYFYTLLSWTIVAETVFNIPGIGLLVVNAIMRRDYTVVQGVVVFIALASVIVNLVVDILYVIIDPRVKFQ
jgi:peptide/nickel transport system permease protein